MTEKTCINCGQPLTKTSVADICPRCNSEDINLSDIFIDPGDSADYMFIECPGATLYADGTNDIVAGAKFIDDDNPTTGFEIVDHPVYAPTHTKGRRIKREAAGNIRRCQGCQDLTVRMRRREGPDCFIPSVKHPGRKKLKTVTYRTYA